MFPPEKGGNASRIHDTAIHLSERGWEVVVLSPPPCYPPGQFKRSWQRTTTETLDSITVHRLWTWQTNVHNPGILQRLPYYLLFGVHAMVWLLLYHRRYDVVLTSTPPITTGAPGLLARAFGTPLVVDVRDLWIDASIMLGYLPEGGIMERISRRFQQLVLRTADRILVTTPPIASSIRRTYGECLAGKIRVVPNGVDTDLFRPLQKPGLHESEPRHGENPMRSGPTPDGGEVMVTTADPRNHRPVLIYTGNIGSAQDLESCIRAMAYLEHQDAVLRIIGSGDTETELRRLTEELGLTDCVEFVDPVPRSAVPELLNHATVGIAPLKRSEELAYAMPTKVYEYMACGLPTVVTGCGEIQRFIAESGGGVHAPNDPSQLAVIIDALLADEEKRSDLGAHGRRHVANGFERRAIAMQLSKELERVVDPGRA